MIASGDLTHRGRRGAARRGRRNSCASLGPPVLAVPGNHDIPYTFPARFTRTFARVRAAVGDDRATLFVPGAPRRRAQLGAAVAAPVRRHRDAQLRRGRGAARGGDRARVRVVVLHHHLIGAPWRSRKKPVARRNHVLARARRRGRRPDPRRAHPPGGGRASGTSSRSSSGGERGVVVSIAPGLGQPRPEPPRRGARPARLRDRRACLRSHTYIWRGRRTGASRPSGRSRAAVSPSVGTGLDPCGAPRRPTRAADERDEDAPRR